MPPFEQSVLPARYADSIECDEMWLVVGSKKDSWWLWLSWSYQSTQTLSFSMGARDLATGKVMWQGIPSSFRRKQVYTDGLKIYEDLIPWWRHWVCPKGSGDTCIAEGCNSYLRHRVSYLVRKSASFARNPLWLYRRLYFVLFWRNERIKESFLSTGKTT